MLCTAIAIAQIALTTQLPANAPFELTPIEFRGAGAVVNVDLIFTWEASSQGGRITHSSVHIYDGRGQYIESFDHLSPAAHREGPYVPLVRTYSVTGEKQVIPNLGSRIPVTGFPILGGGEIVRDDWKGNQINPLLHRYLFPGPGSPPENLAFSNKEGDLRIIHGNTVTPLELPEGFQFREFADQQSINLDIYWAQDNVILGRLSGTVPSESGPDTRKSYFQNVRWVDAKLVDLPDPADSEFEGEQEVTTKYGHFMNAAGDIAGLTVFSRASSQQPRRAYFTVWKHDEIALIPHKQNLMLTGITGDGSLTGYTVINDISRPFINIDNEWHDVFETAGIDADHGRIFPFHSLSQALVTWSKDRVSYTAILKINQPSAPSDTADR